MSFLIPRRAWRAAVLAPAVLVGVLSAARAQSDIEPGAAPRAPGASPPAAAASAATLSALDAPLFYQLLIGELELRSGEAAGAYEVILDAARRSRDEQLFRRAVDIALQGRAGEQALAATRAWRNAVPESKEALQFQLQILAALNRIDEVDEPLAALLALTPESERSSLIAALPRFLERAPEKRRSAELLDRLLQPYRENAATRVAARVATGRAWLVAGDADRALALARSAAAAEPTAAGPALLAMELMATQPEAEPLITAFLAQPDVDPALRLAYVRALVGAQRYGDAIAQLEVVTRERPTLSQPYLSLGALHVELHQPEAAEAALSRYLQLAGSKPARAGSAVPRPPAMAAAAGRSGNTDERDESDESGGAEPGPGRGTVQAWLLLSQAAEQRGDFAAADRWLARIDDPKRALEVQVRRATLLARQGKIDAARRLVQQAPEREPGDAREKVIAEAAMLREVKRWDVAYEVLEAGVARFPDDPDLLYEQAMMAEKLSRLETMERLLRRVIEIKPDNAQAHNALGYSLADRGLRLEEAQALIRHALELAPGDPFITDSLGWVEYRMGRLDEAARLLRDAYRARPDVEIAAHLGEVLWALGQREEARRVWRDARARDDANDVLRETLARLQIKL